MKKKLYYVLALLLSPILCHASSMPISQINENSAVYILNSIDKFNLDDVDQIRNDIKGENVVSTIANNHFYVIFNDKSLKYIERIVYLEDDEEIIRYDYIYCKTEAGDKILTDIVVFQKRVMSARISIVRQKNLSKVYTIYAGTNEIREMIYQHKDKGTDILIGYRMPEFNIIAYEIYSKNGFIQKATYYHDYGITTSEWGDVVISPMPDGIFNFLSYSMPDKLKNNVRYIIKNTYPIKSNLLFPTEVEYYSDNRIVANISCKYRIIDSSTLPMIEELNFGTEKKNIIFKYNRNENSYDVFVKKGNDLKKISRIPDITNFEVKQILNKNLGIS